MEEPEDQVYLVQEGVELLQGVDEDALAQVEDAQHLGAKDLHELMRCWENVHRMYQAEAHVRTILFREETRWPGYYFRADFPKLDNDNWLCFVNCKMDPETEQWEMLKRDILPMS